MVAPWRGQRAPSCFYECYDADKQCLDPKKYFLYRRARAEELEQRDWFKIIASCEFLAKQEQDLADKQQQKKPQCKRGKKRKFQPPEERIFRDPADDNIRSYGPRDTEWYRQYVLYPDVDNLKFRRKFQRRFRCSYLSFQKHLNEVKDSDLFKAWSTGSRDVAGKQSSPIELLVLGALRYLGRGWCFDDLEEQTCISEETHRRFMHVYLFWGSTTLYEKYVITPKDGEEAKSWAEEY